MMKRLHCIIMLCAALLALGSMPLAAQSTGETFTKDNLNYKITATGTNPTVEFTGIADVQSVTGDITIPASVTNDDVTYSVTSLSQCCFNNCDLSEKTITVQAAAITMINQAFSTKGSTTDFFKCAKVDLSACTGLTTAGGQAFYYAEIDEIVLPNTIKTLAANSFFGGKYKKLDFSNCTALTVINKAFGYATIDELILPASLNTINTRALDDMTCKRLDFSRCEKLTTVDPQWFGTTNPGACIKTLIFPPNITALKDLKCFKEAPTTYDFSVCSKLTTIGDDAFKDKSVKIVFPTAENNNITVIGQDAFRNYTGGTIDLSTCTKLTSIGNYCFQGCEKTVLLPEGLKSISANAFWQYQGTSITLPSTVERIEGSAFLNSYLTTINWPTGNFTIGESAFKGTAIETLTLPATVTSVGKNAFSGCEKLKKIDLSNLEVSHLDGGFSYCKNIQEIKFPSTLESLGDDVFSSCNIGAGTGHISSDEFAKALEDAGVKLKEIGDWCFSNNNLTSLDNWDFSELRVVGALAFANNEISYFAYPATGKMEAMYEDVFYGQRGDLTLDFEANKLTSVPYYIKGVPVTRLQPKDENAPTPQCLRVIVPMGSISAYKSNQHMGEIDYRDYRVKFKFGANSQFDADDQPKPLTAADYEGKNKLYNITPNQRLIATTAWHNDVLDFRTKPETILATGGVVEAKPNTFDDETGSWKKVKFKAPGEGEGTVTSIRYTNTVDYWDNKNHIATVLAPEEEIDSVTFYTTFSFSGTDAANYPQTLMPYSLHTYHANHGIEDEPEQIGRRPVVDGVVPYDKGIVIDYPKPGYYLVPPATSGTSTSKWVYDYSGTAEDMHDRLTNPRWEDLSETKNITTITEWTDLLYPTSAGTVAPKNCVILEDQTNRTAANEKRESFMEVFEKVANGELTRDAEEVLVAQEAYFNALQAIFKNFTYLMKGVDFATLNGTTDGWTKAFSDAGYTLDRGTDNAATETFDNADKWTLTNGGKSYKIYTTSSLAYDYFPIPNITEGLDDDCLQAYDFVKGGNNMQQITLAGFLLSDRTQFALPPMITEVEDNGILTLYYYGEIYYQREHGTEYTCYYSKEAVDAIPLKEFSMEAITERLNKDKWETKIIEAEEIEDHVSDYWIDAYNSTVQNTPLLVGHFNENHDSEKDHNVVIGIVEPIEMWPYWTASPYEWDGSHEDFLKGNVGRMGKSNDFLSIYGTDANKVQKTGDAAKLDSDIQYVNFGISKGYFVQYKSKGTTPANRAYFSVGIHHMPHVQLSSDGGDAKMAIGIIGDNGGTTGITDVTIERPASDAWYTINGTRLNSRPTAKGIYIHGGKKIVVK